MSRLTCAVALALATALVTPAARGEVLPASPRFRWSLDARLGVATAWTTGQSYLGPGTGLVWGTSLRIPIHVEFGAGYHAGSIESAANDTLLYWSRRQSLLVHAAAGYDWTMFSGRLLLRPRLIVGSAFVVDEAVLGGVTRGGLDPRLTLGPGLDVLVRFGDLHAGLDARALFVPSHVAAPIGGLYGVFGFER